VTEWSFFSSLPIPRASFRPRACHPPRRLFSQLRRGGASIVLKLGDHFLLSFLSRARSRRFFFLSNGSSLSSRRGKGNEVAFFVLLFHRRYCYVPLFSSPRAEPLPFFYSYPKVILGATPSRTCQPFSFSCSLIESAALCRLYPRSLRMLLMSLS